MKLSLSWILDHISGSKPKFDNVQVGKLVDKFNKSVAEIEGFKKISLFLDQFTLIKIKDGKSFSLELKQEICGLAERQVAENFCYLLHKDASKNNWDWAKLVDLGSCKDGLVPAIYMPENLISGDWKKSFETEDYILEVDNKSVNHRPDLWGHRGFAREIAAILDLPLKNIDNFVAHKSLEEPARPAVSGEASREAWKLIKENEHTHNASYQGLAVINEAGKDGSCKRFAGTIFAGFVDYS